jgi:hypothetical protein
LCQLDHRFDRLDDARVGRRGVEDVGQEQDAEGVAVAEVADLGPRVQRGVIDKVDLVERLEQLVGLGEAGREGAVLQVSLPAPMYHTHPPCQENHIAREPWGEF